MSPSRNRAITFERVVTVLLAIVSRCNARSTTSRLPARCIHSSVWSHCWEHTQAASWQPRKACFSKGGMKKRKAQFCAFLQQVTSMGRREQRLAAGVLDLRGPYLLNRGDDVVRHRDVIEVLGHLAAALVSPGEELQGLGRRRRVLRLLVDQDERSTGDRPGL